MTLKIARRPRLVAIAATAAMTLSAVIFAGLAMAGSAFADHAHHSSDPPTLNGDWAPFNRCPVDDPAALAIDGAITEEFCISETTPSGSMTTGNLTVPFKHSDHQYAVLQSTEGTPSPTISPAGGVLAAEPVEIPGGLQELICPGTTRVTWRICARLRHHHGWGYHSDDVTWTLESAGDVSNFSLFGGIAPPNPIATVRVKIHLQNRWLGEDCYIGSEAEPIVFEPHSSAQPEVEIFTFATNGAPEPGPLLDIKSVGGQVAESFTVPAVTGCGWGGVLDRAINEKVGLPSSASTNNITFNEGTTNLMGIANPGEVAPNNGKDVSEFWHSAVISPVGGGHGSYHSHGDGHHWHRGDAEGNMRSRFGVRH